MTITTDKLELVPHRPQDILGCILASDLDMASKIILTVIDRAMRVEGRQSIQISAPSIAAQAGCSPNTARRRLRDLEGTWLTTTQASGCAPIYAFSPTLCGQTPAQGEQGTLPPQGRPPTHGGQGEAHGTPRATCERDPYRKNSPKGELVEAAAPAPAREDNDPSFDDDLDELPDVLETHDHVQRYVQAKVKKGGWRELAVMSLDLVVNRILANVPAELRRKYVEEMVAKIAEKRLGRATVVDALSNDWRTWVPIEQTRCEWADTPHTTTTRHTDSIPAHDWRARQIEEKKRNGTLHDWSQYDGVPAEEVSS